MRRTPRRWRLGLGIAALVLVTPLVTAAASTSPSPARASAPNAAPTVNWALAGPATATTAECGTRVERDRRRSGNDWCTPGWTGTLSRPGQVRSERPRDHAGLGQPVRLRSTELA